MRMVFDPAPDGEREALYRRFEQEVAGPLEMEHRFAESSERRRLAIMVSREDHCLSDLLWRWRSGELGADLVAVISNHPDHAGQVGSLGLPFHHIPVEAGGREEAERRALELLAGEVDLLVLARYMQILSRELPAAARRSGDQHPPQLPARLRRRRPLRPRPRARRQADRRHRPLRHRAARRRPDHRPGRDPGQPPRRGRGPDADRARHRAPRPRPRRQGPPRRPRAARRARARSSSRERGASVARWIAQ